MLVCHVAINYVLTCNILFRSVIVIIIREIRIGNVSFQDAVGEQTGFHPSGGVFDEPATEAALAAELRTDERPVRGSASVEIAVVAVSVLWESEEQAGGSAKRRRSPPSPGSSSA